MDGMAHTHGIESVWTVLKHGYNGAYHNSNTKHLHCVSLIKPHLQRGCEGLFMTARVANINTEVLRKCRMQMVLRIEDVAGQVAPIEAIEAGKKYPTFRQLDALAKLYQVPRWVFISGELPNKYDFAKSVPAFRQFAAQTSGDFYNQKIRGLVAQVERLRSLVLEIQETLGEPVARFTPPKLSDKTKTDQCAKEIREWLGVDGPLLFQSWKNKLEQKGIFVFMTSKYKGWSYAGKEQFRGLSINHPTLPVIIINSSDSRKAYSFTLLHELGHLLREEHAIDSWGKPGKQEEKWCDQLAGEILMPREDFLREVDNTPIRKLEDIKKLSKKFHVSIYACLVRLRNLNIVTQPEYAEFEGELKEYYRKKQDELKEKEGGPRRERSKEALDQYGQIYTRTLFQAYYNNEISLHKLCRSLDLKRVSRVMELESKL